MQVFGSWNPASFCAVPVCFPITYLQIFFFQDAYFSAGTGKVYNVVEVALGCQILCKQRCSVVFGPSAEARTASGKRKEEMGEYHTCGWDR